MRRYWYILMVVMVLSGCTDNKEVVGLLDKAEAVMEEHPDSAYQFLCKVDSCIDEQSKGTRMRHLMLKTEAENKLDLQLPSDTIFQEVVDYYDHYGTSNQQLMAHYLLGSIYRNRKEAPMALQCFNDAVEKADTLSDDCDYLTLFKVYGQMADIFEVQVMPDEEIEALKQYSKCAQKAGNIYEYIHGIEFMAEAYDLKGDTTMIIEIEQNAHDMYKKYGYTQDAITAYARTIYIYMNRGEYEKAHQLMQAIENDSGLFDNEGNICAGREHYYYTKGLYYLGIGQLDSAEYEFKRLIPYGYTFDAYRGLLDVSKQRRDAAAILAYTQLYETSFDTLITNIHAQATRQVKGMYDYTRHQRIAEEKQHEAALNRWIWGTITMLLLLVASFIIYQVIRHRKRVVAEHQKEIQHQQEIIHQKSLTLAVLQKHLLEKLANARQLLSDDNAAPMTEEVWKEFEQLINTTDNDFVKRLRRQHRDFKEEDIQLCMLIRMKMDNAVLANIFKISVSAVKKRKLNLKKNGFHITDPQVHLEEIIENL